MLHSDSDDEGLPDIRFLDSDLNLSNTNSQLMTYE